MRWFLLLFLFLLSRTFAGDPWLGMPLQVSGVPGTSLLIEAENFDKGGFFDPHTCGISPPSPVAVSVVPWTGTQVFPVVPTGLFAVPVSPSQVNLSWNAVPTVLAYQIYLNDNMIAETTATSFQHTGLNASTTYNYRVSASGSGGAYGPWTIPPVVVTTPSTGNTCSCKQTYRPDGVNICTGDFVNYYISYDDAGLWVDYTIQVNAVGMYTVELLVAFNDSGCCAAAAYHVEVDGVRVTETIPLGPPLTGGWQTFEWRGKSALIGLIPGIHRLRIVVDKGFFNWDKLRLRYAAGIEWQQIPTWRVYP